MTITMPTPILTAPKRILITDRAYGAIEDEARRRGNGNQIENETGGILIGRRLGPEASDTILITDATWPGENAVQNQFEFNPDVEYVNEQLRECTDRAPGTDYMGTWHKHPPRYPHFSDGDVRTAHATFQNLSYKMAEIVNPIVWIDGDQLSIRYYYMSRAMAQGQEAFRELPNEIVEHIRNDDPRIFEQFSVPRIDRMSEERLRLVDKGYQVNIRRSDSEYYFTVTQERLPDLNMYLVAPRGYPFVAPIIAVERAGKPVAADTGEIISRWSLNPGELYLVDAVDTVVKNILHPPQRGLSRIALLVVLLLAVVAVAIIVVIWRSIDANNQEQAYQSSWATIDALQTSIAAQTPVSVDALETAAADLRAIQGRDPSGASLTRNRDAGQMLGHIQNQIGDLYLQTPNPELARRAYQATGKLNDPTTLPAALSGLTAVARVVAASSATAIAVAQQSVATQQAEQRCQSAQNNASPVEQVSLIQSLLKENVACRSTHPVTLQSLHVARIAAVAQLSDQKKYSQAIDLAKQDLAEVAGQKDWQQETVNALAQVYLTSGRNLFDANVFDGALSTLAQVADLQPSPSADLLAQTGAELQKVNDALIKLDAQTRLATDWKIYDQYSSRGSWLNAAKQLDDIISFTGVRPDPLKYPNADKRLVAVAEYRADAYLRFANQLLLDGQLVKAQSYYDLVRKPAQSATSAQVKRAEGGHETAIRARLLWATVAQAMSESRLIDAKDTLTNLRSLPEMSGRALQPGSRISIDDQLASVNQLLAQTSEPVVTPPTPSDTPLPNLTPAVPPTETPIPAAATATITYQVDVQLITMDEFNASTNGAAGTGVNAFVTAPDGLRMSIVNAAAGVEISFTSNDRLLQLARVELEIRVAQDASGQPITTIGNNRVTPKDGEYYTITITKQP